MKNEEMPRELGPLPISSFFILHSTFDISVLGIARKLLFTPSGPHSAFRIPHCR
jgi:hypothetical protein